VNLLCKKTTVLPRLRLVHIPEFLKNSCELWPRNYHIINIHMRCNERLGNRPVYELVDRERPLKGRRTIFCNVDFRTLEIYLIPIYAAALSDRKYRADPV